MNAFLIYMLKVAVLSALFIALYHLLLSRETFHRTNRVILVSSLVLSYILPFVVITVHRDGAPARMVEITTGNRVEEPAPAPFQPVITSGSVYSSAPQEETVQAVQTQNLSQVIEVSARQDTPVTAVATRKPIHIDWWKVLAGVYLIGLLAVLIYRILCTTKVIRIIRKADVVEKNPDFTLVRTRQSTHPFSWMRYIVMPWEGKAAGQTPVLDHEKAHLAHHHSLELLWTDMLSALQWFNPALLLFRRDLYSIHEFQADADVLSKGYDRKQYQYLMLDCATDKNELRAANTFRKSTLEGRIDMINRKKSTGSSILKVAYIPVLLLLSLGAFAETVYDNGLDETIEVDNYVRIDGLWYKFKGNQVRVVSRKTSHDYPADIVIPDTIIYKNAKYPVTSIGPRAFQYDEKIKSVTIPSTVQEIEESSFYGCTSLEKVIIPPSITSIGKSAFYYCTNLKSINIPASVRKIEERAFSPAGFQSVTVEPGNAFYDSRDNCNAIIETVSNTLLYGSGATVIPPTVTTIAPMAFEGISSLESIDIPASVTEIGDGAFRGCASLKSIEIPETVQKIGLWCFEGSGLKHAVINGNVEFISFGFTNSDSLETMIFGPGVTRLYFPQDCKNLKSIHIPSTVKEILIQGERNLNLESITVDEANPYYDSRDNCNAIIETATNRLILACSNTVIPNTVRIIDQFAFTGSMMKELHIPASVEYIHDYAFDTELSIGRNNHLDYRGALTKITVDPANPVFDSRDNCNAIIHKPSNTLLWAFNTTVIPQSITNIREHAFMALTDLKEITIPDAVRSIAFRAFFECGNLEKITIGAGVTEMSPYAFQGSNGKLTEIKVSPANRTYDSRNDCNAIIETATGTLLLGSAGTTVVPDGVTAIGQYAFEKNKKLESIKLPPSVKTIDNFAFYGCSNLEDINLENVTRKGERAFEGCAFNSYKFANEVNGYLSFRIKGKEAVLNRVRDNAPSDITIPESFSYEGKDYTVTEIAENALNSNTDIESVTVPATVRVIGNNAFDGCTGLKKVILEDGLKSIGDDAFAYCGALESIKLPSTLEYIGRTAFTRSGIKSLVIPESVTDMGRNITLDCKSLKSLSVNPGNRTFDSRKNCNAIIRTENNLLLEGCCKTRIPKDVTAIAPYAFAGSTGLKSIDIPQSVKYIFEEAFAFCDLEKIVIPASVSLLENNPFLGCSHLKSISVQKGNPSYESIPGCNAIISNGNDNMVIRHPEVTTLLTSLGYNQNFVNYWEREAGTLIQGCRNTVIPPAAKIIGISAFAFCEGLESIVIPESVTNVLSSAFLHCDDLKELHLSASVIKFYKSDYCPKLEKITVAQENPVYYSPQGSNAIIEKEEDILIMGCKSTVIPNTVKIIGEHSFEHVLGLKSIEIPNSVEMICDQAFYDCSDLEFVSIPASVTFIGGSSWDEPEDLMMDRMRNPFSYCPNLKHITVDSQNTVFDSRNDCNAVIIKSQATMLVASADSFEPESVNSTHFSAYNTLKTWNWEPDYLSTSEVFPDGRMIHTYIAGDYDD